MPTSRSFAADHGKQLWHCFRCGAGGNALDLWVAVTRQPLHAAVLDLYKLEIGRYPTTQEGLQALVSAPAGTANWNGPYWKKQSVPKDPWGNEYKYSSPAANAPYEIISLGADGKEGGEGPNKDLSSSQ